MEVSAKTFQAQLAFTLSHGEIPHNETQRNAHQAGKIIVRTLSIYLYGK
jgi:hypothetical protein